MRAELEILELSGLHLFEQRLLPGPGWKVTMDGYLEAYHHDSVHANTLSKHTIGNLLVHDIFGHHQVLTMARRNIADLDAVPESQRSEEHTSELQSLMRISYAVFCLKKKKRKQNS